MKKLTYLLFLAIGVTSCSVESIDSTENLLTADANYNSASESSIEYDRTVCVGEMATFTFNFPQAYNSNEKVQKTGVQLELLTSEGWVSLLSENYDGSGPKYFSYDFGDEGVFELQYRIGNGSGGDNKFTPISVEVKNCCEESFTYINNNDGTYTFNYTVGEDMDEAEVMFTFAQGSYVSGLGEEFSQNGNNGQTYKAIMDLEKCDVLEYTVTLTPNCNGIGSKESNVWTDFKVNDVSKKANEEDKFVAACNS